MFARVREIVGGLLADGVLKPGGRQELIPSSSDCFPNSQNQEWERPDQEDAKLETDEQEDDQS